MSDHEHHDVVQHGFVRAHFEEGPDGRFLVVSTYIFEEAIEREDLDALLGDGAEAARAAIAWRAAQVE